MTIGRNSSKSKKSSLVARELESVCAVSARRKQVLRYTASVATERAARKVLNVEDVARRDLTANQPRHKMKNPKDATCVARPARRSLFGPAACLLGESGFPIAAALAVWKTWSTVAATSAAMKVQRIRAGGTGANSRPTRLMATERTAYNAAEKPRGAMTMKKYWRTKNVDEYGSTFDDNARGM